MSWEIASTFLAFVIYQRYVISKRNAGQVNYVCEISNPSRWDLVAPVLALIFAILYSYVLHRWAQKDLMSGFFMVLFAILFGVRNGTGKTALLCKNGIRLRISYIPWKQVKTIEWNNIKTQLTIRYSSTELGEGPFLKVIICEIKCENFDQINAFLKEHIIPPLELRIA